MSLSLRDQLLQAGLISKKQAQDADKQRHQQRTQHQQQPKKQKIAPPPKPATPSPEAQKRARDQALSRQAQEKAEQKARRAQVKQLVEQNKLPKVEGDNLYNFVDGRNIRRIPVTPEMRSRLGAGELYVVRCDGRYEVVPAEAAARIRERDERAVMPPPAAASPKPDEDDPYKNYVVPDDLVW